MSVMNDSKDHLYQGLEKQPIQLQPNRVWRTYNGGRLLDVWQGKEDARDTSCPEEWVASTVRATNPGREHLNDEGLSHLAGATADVQVSLEEIIAQDPTSFLGVRHVDKFGSSPAVLVKVLDAGERLTIQVHPDKQVAQDKFRSEFGKTEAWYVIGGRTVDGEAPYVLLGFKSGMTKEKWKALFDQQDIEGMINALHKLPINQGDVYLIAGGTPHAIGQGCLLIEIQEPTDFTLRTERVTPNGRVIGDHACHQGIGFEAMFDCFHYDGYTVDELKSRFKLDPTVLHQSEEARLESLVSEKDTDTFRMNELSVYRTFHDHHAEGVFSVVIIVEGKGTLTWANGEMNVQQGVTLFLPAMLESFTWTRVGDKPLRVVRCFPPKA